MKKLYFAVALCLIALSGCSTSTTLHQKSLGEIQDLKPEGDKIEQENEQYRKANEKIINSNMLDINNKGI